MSVQNNSIYNDLLVDKLLLRVQVYLNISIHAWLGSMSEKIEIRASTIDALQAKRVKSSTCDQESYFSDGCPLKILVSGLQVL